MASIEETETKRDIRTRLKRKPFAGIGEADVVGYFPHQKVPSHVTIREHKVDSRIVYSVKTEPKSDCVVELGTEMSSLDNGFDYAVVAVNKNTGETQWRPAKMFKFEGRFGDNPESIIGIKRPDAVDYSANNTITMDSWAMKRHQLTESFGSSMKKKIQDAAYRRSVNESVLDEMVKTSFASDTVIKGKTEAKLEDITLVQHADSSILPPAVQAELPKDIYPVEMFVSPEDAEQMREKAEWRIKMPKAELLESGWSDTVFKSCPDYFSYYGAKAVGFELLAFQVYVLGKMSKNKSIVMSDMDNAPFDLAVVQKVQVEYMPKEVDRGVSGKAIRRMIFSSEEKQRLAAYTLALALTLSPGCALPVSLWEGALGMPPKQCEKLLIALGCSLSFCSMEESLRTGSLQSARLLRPPELNKKTPRKIRR